jgi:anaerobic magnesium-protoporphyrin IX monomethyl ester cyclase
VMNKLPEKVLLIRPPERYLPHRQRPMAYLPIGLLQIAACLEQNGIPVDLIDGIMPKDIRNEGENFFGATLEDMRSHIASRDFSIAGISAQFTFQWENARETARICKEIAPGSMVVVGGAHASVMFEQILQENPFIDVVVRGEGEIAFPELVKRVQQNKAIDDIPGIAFRSKGTIASNPNEFIKDLDTLPLPAYHLVDMDRFFELTKTYSTRTSYDFPGWERGVTVITSRGCPFSCVFCSIQLHMGSHFRAHSPGYVIRHIEHLAKTYGTKYIHFEDDNISQDPKRFGEILDGIIEKKLPIRWDTPNGVRADTFTMELLEKCRNSGCTHLIFGIESGVQNVLTKTIRKGVSLKRIEQTLGMARRAGVDSRAFFVIGMPGETKKDIIQTVNYMLNLRWKYECFGGFGLAVPLYGTRMFDICKENGYFTREPSIENLSRAYAEEGIIKTPEFDPAFLKQMQDRISRMTKSVPVLIVIRKIILHPWLLFYMIKEMIRLGRSGWSVVFHKVLYFHNAIAFDQRLQRDSRHNRIKHC